YLVVSTVQSLLRVPRPAAATLFPYTTLFRSWHAARTPGAGRRPTAAAGRFRRPAPAGVAGLAGAGGACPAGRSGAAPAHPRRRAPEPAPGERNGRRVTRRGRPRRLHQPAGAGLDRRPDPDRRGTGGRRRSNARQRGAPAAAPGPPGHGAGHGAG